MQNIRYDFSSAHVDVPHYLAEEIMQWGNESIPDHILFRDPKDPFFGRENEMHVTILYGIHSDKPRRTFETFRNESSVDIQLGEIDLFTRSNLFDVVFVKVHSQQICALNEKLKSNVVYSNRYESYVPHVTIAYVKKDKAWGLKGDKEFVGRNFTANNYVFSSRNGKRHIKDFHQITGMV